MRERPQARQAVSSVASGVAAVPLHGAPDLAGEVALPRVAEPRLPIVGGSDSPFIPPAGHRRAAERSSAWPTERRGLAWDPIQAAVDCWSWYARLGDIWWTRAAGTTAIAAAGRTRFESLVRFARERSRFYRNAYRGLPAGGLSPSRVPVVTKRELMDHFDDWVTDPALNLADVTAFLADRDRIGERHLGRYVIWKSSGSTGEPGIYVQDGDALETFDALMAVHLDPARITAASAWRITARGGRTALIAATGDHFASIASWQRLTRNNPWMAARSFSIMDPLPRLVAQLNAYRPAFVASYPTLLALLADERKAGRLAIDPVGLWSGGECLPASVRAELETAFGCPVVNDYGSSECMSIAFGCAEGWLHVNADWVLLEPVDEDFRPTPPGETSRTVLLTNLANRVQPIIRYDLGDSVIVNPAPCACGNPLPAIQVEGRHDDVLAMTAPDGRILRLLPLALTTVVEDAAPASRFQIVQSAPDRLLLRLDCHDPADRQAAWHAVEKALRRHLVRHSLPNVRVALDVHRPRADRRSGKMKEVIASAKRP